MSPFSSLSAQSHCLSLGLWVALRPPEVSLEKLRAQGPVLGKHKQPLEMSISETTCGEGCKHLHLGVSMPRPIHGPSIQTPTATEREQERDAVPTCRHLVPSTITSCIQLIHLRTCRRPSPFCNRSWWPTVTSKKCSKSSRNQHMGNGRHLNSGALTWN